MNKISKTLTLIALFASTATGLVTCTEKGREIWEKWENTSSEVVNINLNGDWDMIFDFARCSNSNFSNKELKCYYSIKLFQEGNKVTGNGYKHSESLNGKITKYSKIFPIRIEGVVKNGRLAATLNEKNLNDEVTGTVEISLNKRWIFTGIYKASEDNCNGDIKMEKANK